MSAGAIGGLTSLNTTAATTSAQNAFADLSSEQFIRIMITELSNQDPFEPNDSAALLEQLSSLRNIESQLALQDQFENLVLQNQVTQASALIGKIVSGLSESNDQVNGLVTSVHVEDGNAVLELDTGQQLPMDRLTLIAGADG